MHKIIAIDGTAASGKGTLAKAIAKELGFEYLDTGKLYRYVGWICAKTASDHPDEAAALAAVQQLLESDVAASLEEPELLDDDIGELASQYSVLPKIRAALLHLQREFATQAHIKGAVLDGRDIGTVVCPQADAKIFIDADCKIRAQRRTAQLHNADKPAIYAAVLQQMQMRDHRDAQRSAAPMKPAPDASLLDTSHDKPEQSLQKALQFIKLAFA